MILILSEKYCIDTIYRTSGKQSFADDNAKKFRFKIAAK
jgi:hypothetical protein